VTRPSGRQHGIAAIEALVAVPVLLFVGLGALQWGLVHQARLAINLALHEAGRVGSVAHADDTAIRDGLARGLMPWLHGASDAGELVRNLALARRHVAEAEARGWLRLERQSPSAASFEDWAEPARDAFGDPIEGVREIPNDDLVHRATRTRPAGGVAGDRAGEPIGAASGQTLSDANLLRLRMTYGVPLSVPVVGRLIAWALRAWHGCAVGAPRTIGALRLDAPSRGPAPDPDACTLLGSAGDGPARLPVSASTTVRMQTPARERGDAAPLASGPGRSPGPGRVGGGADGLPAPSDPSSGGPVQPPGAPTSEPPWPVPAPAATPVALATRPPATPRPDAATRDAAFCRTPDR
jgi:hypothetical protein